MVEFGKVEVEGRGREWKDAILDLDLPTWPSPLALASTLDLDLLPTSTLTYPLDLPRHATDLALLATLRTWRIGLSFAPLDIHEYVIGGES